MEVRSNCRKAGVLTCARAVLTVMFLSALAIFDSPASAETPRKAKPVSTIVRSQYECELRVQFSSQRFEPYEMRVFLPMKEGLASLELWSQSGTSVPAKGDVVTLSLSNRIYILEGPKLAGRVRVNAPPTFLPDLADARSIVLMRNKIHEATADLEQSSIAVDSLRACAGRAATPNQSDAAFALHMPPVLN